MLEIVVVEILREVAVVDSALGPATEQICTESALNSVVPLDIMAGK